MAIQAQLCNSQHWIDGGSYGCVNGGLNNNNQFCFGVQQQPQLMVQNNNNNNHQSMAYAVMSQAQKHNQEIDHFIRFQNEGLRSLIEEQRKQEIAMLVQRMESKALILLRQKDEQILQANKREMELQNMLTRLEIEKLRWQKSAQDSEAMVESLSNTLEQIRENNLFNNNINEAEDAESCYEHDQQQEVGSSLLCKNCNSENAVALFLPCRHLCCCKVCEIVLDCCPICGVSKKATIEALIF